MIKELKDTELIKEIREKNSNEAFIELSARHSGIFISMVQKFGGYLTPAQKSDFIDSKDFHIHEIVKEYDENKSKFSTYLGQTTKYLCLNQGNKNMKFNTSPLDEVEFKAEDNSVLPDEACINHETFEKIIDVIDNHKDERVKTLFHERYFNPNNNKIKTWRQVAKVVGLSVQGCIDLHDSVITNLQRRINYA